VPQEDNIKQKEIRKIHYWITKVQFKTAFKWFLKTVMSETGREFLDAGTIGRQGTNATI